ncbi:membrane protein insertase YidC [Candidatus Nitronereus thalassa]|uniref:Membrane protein insertase YidC n=1 Tax=Candidatus Nitronereus thalassa TaxID=3020898 RepID=A0ABU3K934_9BACT|nr:membrane protein insertase YidC [Candidatus Nitronereus thalassa]MDT7042900.1 membrane protein insertase YidC [Candidatus Nitronereus thalassa]
MEKRIIIFLVISLGIILGYDVLLKEFGFLPQPVQVEESQSFESDSKDSSKEIASQSIRKSSETGEEISGVSVPTELHESFEFIETSLYQASISNRGAQIHSWKLKHYLTQDGETSDPIEFVYQEGHFAGPLTVQVSDPTLSKLLKSAIYQVGRDFETLDSTHPTGTLTYTFADQESGIAIKKELTFHHDSYIVDVVIRTEGLDDKVEVLLGTNFGVVEWGQGFIGALGPAWMIGETLEKETPEPEIRKSGDIQWAALQDKYFISVMIPESARGVFARTETERVVTGGVEFSPESDNGRIVFQLYSGPKQFDAMKALGHGLEDTIDFGWFIYGSWDIVRAVAKPLFYVLRFLYEYTQNYGVAIILLTCGIKLLFVPLQYKSYKSMQGMQKIQPKVQAMQQKFKDDRERLNRELIKLYKEHKVNPVGGCLPMLLQMPAFISLFNILYMTVDLRQAPFALWITDLSVPDPFYVLPILMGVSMVLQQKIMPTTMDPTQAKMMLLLPVFLTFLFLTFPAGLVLYWVTNNVLTITQQFVTDRFILKKPTFSQAPPEPSEALPEPAEEPAGSKKKKGKGKNSQKESV